MQIKLTDVGTHVMYINFMYVNFFVCAKATDQIYIFLRLDSSQEVLAFDRRLSDSEMSTLLTAPTMELMGWEAENFS